MTRRTLLESAALAAATAGGLNLAAPSLSAQATPAAPWYLRAYRWGQTNITEKDPVRYDIDWWRKQWKQTHVQAVIINAGGIVAYYPSKFPLHHRAEFLGDRDLYGDLTKAAHEDGLFVMARMDSNRTAEDFFQAHPGWFTRNAKGEPYRAADKYVTCINSPYYDQYLPEVITEIIDRSHPEGVTDNSWAGMGRESICYCANCERRFSAKAGMALPKRADWDDAAYRKWIVWSYERRIELWDLNNQITRKAGGKDCIWSGMNSGSVTQQARSFRDLREICKRAHIMMLDHQRRDDETGFQQNGDTGKRVHQVLGWDKLAPESMALYQSGPGYFRVASKPPAEARMWMMEGLAGGIQPWWHHISAYHEDRRQYRTAEPVMQWHQENERFLMDREPVASVGLVWSQRNTDFYGREDPAERVDGPYTGFMHALVRARIPYLPVHVDDIAATASLETLILPNVAALSDAQCAAIRAFVKRGGSLLATGSTSLYNEWGDPREDYGLADIFGVHTTGPAAKLTAPPPVGGRRNRELFSPEPHTYLRLSPEWRARVDGPHIKDEPAASGERHAVLHGFDETDILPYGGGSLSRLRVDGGATVPLTYVPPFPVYPPETAWMRTPKTDIAGLVLSSAKGGDAVSRVAFLPADIDRRYAHDHLPDHADLLANIVRWCAGDSIPVTIEGPGMLDCHLYRQEGNRRYILHLVNLSSGATWRPPMEESLPVGPIRVKVNVPGTAVRLLVASGEPSPRGKREGNSFHFEIPSIREHEVAVIST